MARKESEHPLLLLDACCIINLFATGRLEEILALLPYRFATSRLVATEEVLSIARTDASPDGSLAREILSPASLEHLGDLALLEIRTDEEKADFIRFADEIDDGEASVCALALSNRGSVATDDRRALRMLGRIAPQVPTLQTPEILYEWARLADPAEPTLKNVLLAVRVRARFFPRRDAPRFEWWNRYVR